MEQLDDLKYFGCEGDPVAMELVDLGLASTRASRIGEAIAEQDRNKLHSAVCHCDIENLDLLIKIRPRLIIQAVGYELSAWGGTNCPLLERLANSKIKFSLEWVREALKEVK
jgi:hypothetical protein